MIFCMEVVQEIPHQRVWHLRGVVIYKDKAFQLCISIDFMVSQSLEIKCAQSVQFCTFLYTFRVKKFMEN